MICIGSVYEHDATNRWFNVRVSNLEELEKALQDNLNDTKFVFWLGVSNITGEIFPVKDIGYLCHKYNAFYICDTTALLGHVAIEPNIDDWCDFLVLDGHKAGTELGIGCCWVSDRLDKWLNGFKLHGTPNLAGALALAQAVEDACDEINLDCREKHYFALWKYLGNLLAKNHITFDLVDKHGDMNERSHAINAIRLPGFNAEALQQYLASKDIYIGVGHSSCSNDTRVLKAYELSKDEAHKVIRISFGKDSSVDEVKALVTAIKEFRDVYC